MRLEVGIDIRDDPPTQVGILDRRDVLSTEDLWALGAGIDKLPTLSNIRK